MVRMLVLVVKVYQVTISQLFTGSCRFVPSCSQYAIEALERHGAVRGMWLSVCRLLRCQPFFRGGLDQVPPIGRTSSIVAATDTHGT